jgi:UDP:flavonoid glycosyltransferase YjiC (YdhE family)
MASILYAWEFGANLGHVGAFMPLAKQLRELGHEVHWAVTQPAQVGDFLAGENFRWLAAPSIVEQARQGPPLTYADILLRFGYADSKALFGLVGAWRELMRVTNAALVMTDHAPTAVLAARILGLPVMMFSNGFTVPPRQYPLPNMRPWTNVPDEQLRALDDTARDSINTVLQRYGQPPINCTAALFDVTEETLITFPELDHYVARGPMRYWGSLPSAGTGINVIWPAIVGPRIFAYLRRETTHHLAVLDALLQLGVATALYFPECPAELRALYQAPHLNFLDSPADIAQMAREADCAVTYSSLATTTAFLLAGKPLLLLPSHLEQFLLARRVVDFGAGILVNPEQAPGNLRDALNALLQQPGYRENARAFATKYAAFDQQQVLNNLVRRINELVQTSTDVSHHTP